MKGYLQCYGWKFPLQGGPWDQQILRIGFCRYPGDEYDTLDPKIPAPGGHYEKREWFDKNGVPKMVAGFKKKRVQGVVYVWVPSRA